MQSENPSDPTNAGNDPNAPREPMNTSGSYQSPADYYATPPPAPGGRSGCPKWLLTGCGLGGCLMLILIFVGGAFFMKSGMPKVLDYAFSKVESEVSAIAAPEVTIEQKDALRDEIARFRANIRTEKVDVTQIQPVLKKLQTATGDQRLSPEEFNELTSDLRILNDKAEGKVSTLPDPVAPEATPTDDTSTTATTTETSSTSQEIAPTP